MSAFCTKAQEIVFSCSLNLLQAITLVHRKMKVSMSAASIFLVMLSTADVISAFILLMAKESQLLGFP